MSEHSRTVGIVGLGTIGGSFACRFLAQGYRVVGYDVRPEATQALAGLGGSPAGSLGEVAATARVAIVLVQNDQQVKDVCLGTGGLVPSGAPGNIIALCSTVEPTTVRAIAEKASEAGVDVLDAPIGGGAHEAAVGRLPIFVGGDAAVLERAAPVLREIAGEYLFLLGPVGSGQVAKMGHVMLFWTLVLGSYEALALGHAAGLDVEQLRAALLTTNVHNVHLERIGPDTRPLFVQKDLAHALDLASSLDLELPVCALAREILKTSFEARIRNLFAER